MDDQGTFKLKAPHGHSYLYFPLVSPGGMMSSITPSLNGDAKANQNAFLLLPVSVEDLHNTRSARNFWVRIDGEPWSVSGNSARQICQSGQEENEKAVLQAGFLWHEIQRTHAQSGLLASTLSLVPSNGDKVELMRVTLTNQGDEILRLDPIAAIPIYGRSADNLRDHRHVTALLHRITCHPHGILVKPTMSFDERGHAVNHITYGVLGADGEGNPPQGFTPLVEDFIGEGGNLAWPEAVIREDPELVAAGSRFEGFEAIGGLHFSPIRLQPGESRSYVLILSIMAENEDPAALIDKYGGNRQFDQALGETKAYWGEYLAGLQFDHQQKRLDGWLRWVTLQPVLRRIMGNSFLPYHDYGRGGRGWRDLWQDLLAVLLTEQTAVDRGLLDYYAGIRMDGSNATIVGARAGEFKADRNSIPRVWMDHGAWPLITTRLYMDQTGDIDFLLRTQGYFRDHLTHRCKQLNPDWDPAQGTVLKSDLNEVVEGSILEHLLVQHLTVFFNVGEHNLIKLEGGDWNDGLDMAADRGESVAFSALYAGNLKVLSALCTALAETGREVISINVEVLPLLDQIVSPVDYSSISDKQSHLQKYFDSVQGALSGEKRNVHLAEIASDLAFKAEWLTSLIRQQEWISGENGEGWFNGYYDNRGERVEGQTVQDTRMTLTGQVFPLMAGIATDVQAEQIIRTAERCLYDPALRGYRLKHEFWAECAGPRPGFCFRFRP